MENSKKNGLSKKNNDELRKHYAQLFYQMEIIEEEQKDEKLAIIKEAKMVETPLIAYLREQHLNPKRSGNNSHSWIAKCPCGGNHFINVVTKNDEWGCGYCGRKGNQPELEKWIQEIKTKEDQKNLSRMLKELKKGSIQTEETLKWWINRY